MMTTQILKHELALRGRSFDRLATESGMTPETLAGRLQRHGFLPPALRFELGELLGMPLNMVDAGIVSV